MGLYATNAVNYFTSNSVCLFLTLSVFVLGICELASSDYPQWLGVSLVKITILGIAYVGVFIACGLHLDSIAGQISEVTFSESDGLAYKKYIAFNGMRLVFLLMIMQPTFMIFLKQSVLSWVDNWALVTFFWFTRFLLTFFIVVLFRPGKGMEIFEHMNKVAPENLDQIPVGRGQHSQILYPPSR